MIIQYRQIIIYKLKPIISLFKITVICAFGFMTIKYFLFGSKTQQSLGILEISPFLEIMVLSELLVNNNYRMSYKADIFSKVDKL